MALLFGETQNLAMSDEIEPPFLKSMTLFTKRFHLTKHIPILARAARKLPVCIAERVFPGYISFRQVRRYLSRMSARALTLLAMWAMDQNQELES